MVNNVGAVGSASSYTPIRGQSKKVALPPAKKATLLPALAQMVQNASKSDYTVYKEESLKNSFYDPGSPAPGIPVILTGTTSLIKISYKLLKDLIHPTTESNRDLLIQGTRDLHGIVHGISLILKYLILFNISVVTLSIVAPIILLTGVGFIFLELTKDILELIKLKLADGHLEMPLYSELESFKKAESKEVILENIKTLTRKIEKNLVKFEAIFGKETIKTLEESLVELKNKVSLSTKNSFQKLTTQFLETKTPLYLEKLASHQLKCINSKYNVLHSKQIEFLHSEATKLSKSPLTVAKASLKILIENERLKNAKDLANVTSPGLAALFFKYNNSIEKGLGSQNPTVRKKTTESALRLFYRMEKIIKVKKIAVIICMISHAVLLASLATTYLGFVHLPIIATFSCVAISFAKKLYSSGHIRSTSGDYEGVPIFKNDLKKVFNSVYKVFSKKKTPYFKEDNRSFVEKVEVHLGLTEIATRELKVKPS